MLRTCEWCNEPASVFKVFGQPVCLCGSCHRRRNDRLRLMILEICEVQQQIVDDSTIEVEVSSVQNH